MTMIKNNAALLRQYMRPATNAIRLQTGGQFCQSSFNKNSENENLTMDEEFLW